jgi:hypothetical protein
MALITKGRLAEEILRLYYGGNIPVAGKVRKEEVFVSIGQVINTMLKTEYFNVSLPGGEVIPNGAMVGLYENIAVTKLDNRSYCTLPVKPLKLPRDLGIYQVWDMANPDCMFVPLQMGQWAQNKTHPMLSGLLGKIGYEPYGERIVFTSDITNNGVDDTTVGMRLVIADLDQYGEYDMLPVPPEYELAIKQQVLSIFSTEQVADKIVDPSVKEQKGVPIKQQGL